MVHQALLPRGRRLRDLRFPQQAALWRFAWHVSVDGARTCCSANPSRGQVSSERACTMTYEQLGSSTRNCIRLTSQDFLLGLFGPDLLASEGLAEANLHRSHAG
jgi:hypothetical protein